jgi:hypothetical protein
LRTQPTNWHWHEIVGWDFLPSQRDGIGARLKLTVSTANGRPRQVYRTVRAGTAFSAQNDIRAIHFALGEADTIHAMEITWTDGVVQTIVDSNLLVNERRTFFYGS